MFGKVVPELFQYAVNISPVSKEGPLILDESAAHNVNPVPVFLPKLEAV